jgi:hypothetical protein
MKHLASLGASLALGAALCAPATAQTYETISLEAFDYPFPDVLGNQNGGVGWANPWWAGANGDDVVVQADPPTNPGNPLRWSGGDDGVGNYAQQNIEFGGAYRFPDAGAHPDVTDNLMFGVDGSKLWFTFHTRRIQSFSTDNYGGFSLNEQGVGEKLFVGSPWQANAWGYDDQTGNPVVTAQGPPQDIGGVVVFSIEYSPGAEFLSMWVDPASAHPDPNVEPPLLAGPIQDHRWNEIRISSGGGATLYYWDGLHIEKELAPLVIPSGDDLWQTPPPTGFIKSHVDFSGAPLPADFFEPGSEPFDGLLILRGDPLVTQGGSLGTGDTIVRRLADTQPLDVGGQDTVPIEIVALSLTSCQPIQVVTSGSPVEWDVAVHLSSAAPQTQGTMTVVRTHQDGGYFDSTLPVVPKLVFTRSDGSGSPVVLDSPTLSIAFDSLGAAWTQIGGVGGFDPLAEGITPVIGGVAFDGDGDGVFEGTTIGNSLFQVAVGASGCGAFECTFNQENAQLGAHSVTVPGDSDGDGWPDFCDNCPNDAQTNQADTDGDGIGDVCDALDDTLHINEIYASHSGTDDQEFIELIGVPGQDLTGVMVLVVEGDGAGAGTLDRAWDLTGFVMPADGYFVLGNTAVANLDLDIGSDNAIENGTETFYLVRTSNTAAVVAALGTSVDPDGDGVSSIPCVVDDVLETVAMVDSGVFAADRVYDHALVNALGPDGTFFPAGIFRGGDYPSDWCAAFLDFDVVANLAEPRTPGGPNGPCPTPRDYCECFDGGGFGQIACDPAALHSGGDYAKISATPPLVGVSVAHLEVVDGPVNQFGYFLVSTSLVEPGVAVSNGFLCMGTPIGRYNPSSALNNGNPALNSVGQFDAGGVLQNLAGTSSSGTGYDVVAQVPNPPGGTIVPGTTFYFQLWFRDAQRSNFSTAVGITF